MKNLTRRETLKTGATFFFTACTTNAFAAENSPEKASKEKNRTLFPKENVFWSNWEEKGWIKETVHYKKRDNSNVQCTTCPNRCFLTPGQRSVCKSRINIDGKLYSLVYGNPCSANNDPIEKKPLYHFLPGTNIFSIAVSGCGFKCLNCQNWSISQARPEELKDPMGDTVLLTPMRKKKLSMSDLHRLSLFPEDVAAMTEHYGLPSIAYTYSEPTTWFEYMTETAKAAKKKKLKNVWVTCGYINKEPLEELCQYIDAANVDLKSFSNETYKKLNSGMLQPVLDTLKTLKQNNVWFEITNLVVPTYTDNLDEISRMCDWIAENLGTDYPIHFSRFHPAFKLQQLPQTPADTLIKAREKAKNAGLNYVYIGNIAGIKDSSTTFCPKCKKPVIERYGYHIISNRIKDGRCPECNEKIAGVWL